MRYAKYELVKSHSLYTLTRGSKRCGEAALRYLDGLLILTYAGRTVKMTLVSEHVRQGALSSVKSAASFYRTLKWNGGGTINFEIPNCQ